LLVTKKIIYIKKAVNTFLYTYSFYDIEEYLSQSCIKYCITRFFIIVIN